MSREAWGDEGNVCAEQHISRLDAVLYRPATFTESPQRQQRRSGPVIDYDRNGGDHVWGGRDPEAARVGYRAGSLVCLERLGPGLPCHRQTLPATLLDHGDTRNSADDIGAFLRAKPFGMMETEHLYARDRPFGVMVAHSIFPLNSMPKRPVTISTISSSV